MLILLEEQLEIRLPQWLWELEMDIIHTVTWLHYSIINTIYMPHNADFETESV